MNRSIMILSVLLLAGCAHQPTTRTAQSASPTGPLFGELPAQELKRGECALVLWSRKQPSVRFLMALNNPAVARVQIQGHVEEFSRVVQTGRPIYGQFADQHYRGNGTSLEVNLSADERSELSSGAIVSAVVEYSDAQGWMTVVPAAGLIACQP